jgi:hypothetical protein
MTKKLGTNEIIAILESGSFDGLIGVVEDDHFECKAEPYRLEEEHQKLELAKDVSALANAHGGIILIGAQTEVDSTRATDVVKKFRLIPDTRINISQYEDVIRTWVYPPIRDLEIRKFDSSSDPALGLVGIMVGDQEQTWRPYLMTRSIEQSGKVSTTLFGYAERGSGKSAPMSVQQLHTLLRDGYRVGTGTLLPVQRPEQESPEKGPTDSLTERIERGIKDVELADRPVFILAAAPEQKTELPSLFSARDSDLVKLLEDPPNLRASGFGPDAGINSRIVEGNRRRTIVPHYKLLEIWRDGTIIMVGAGDEDFLAWGSKMTDKLRINQLVLVECTYLFAKLFRAVLYKAKPVPSSTLFRLSIRIPAGKKALLYPGPLTNLAVGEHYAPGLECLAETSVTLEEDPGGPSFRLVADAYHWFSFEDDKIPYTSVKEDGQRLIDPTVIIERNIRAL